MKSRFLLCLCLLFGACVAHAQLVVTEECILKDRDLTASRLNDSEPFLNEYDEVVPFAIVRVGLAEPDATFESAHLMKVVHKEDENEYWVYLPENTTSMTIKTKRYTPKHYKFPQPLKARNTYVMALDRPKGDKYDGKLHISSNVTSADVYVDGQKVSDGVPFTWVGNGGMHTVELKADGYDSQKREIDVPMGQQANVVINLFASGSLDVDGVSYGFVPIEAVSFTMGGPLNYYTRPAHNVNLKPFSAGGTLVSVELWSKVMGQPADDRIKGSNGQVINVSYDEIELFLDELNEKTGKEYRLPTEAEWEYIAKNAHSLGIQDIGTSLEWCSDWFGRYDPADNLNPTGPAEGVLRVVRGGSEFVDSDPTYYDKTYRWRRQPDTSSPQISFRIVE